MDLIPGFLQGITRVIISHPFDYIKLHLQTNNSDSIKDFFKKNNWKNVFRGIQVPLIIVPIDRAIQFKLFETFNKNYNPFISGIICGMTSTILTLPSNYIANNFILNNHKSLIDFSKNIIKTKLSVLTYGYKPELFRSILGTAIYLGIYGNLRTKYGNDTKQSIINSSIAGISVWTITYPIDTLKVEQQTNGNKDIIKILLYRIKNYGFFNLWKGITPIYVRTLPSSIVGMIVYENSKKILNI